jgi:hypothetical protein
MHIRPQERDGASVCAGRLVQTNGVCEVSSAVLHPPCTRCGHQLPCRYTAPMHRWVTWVDARACCRAATPRREAGLRKGRTTHIGLLANRNRWRAFRACACACSRTSTRCPSRPPTAQSWPRRASSRLLISWSFSPSIWPRVFLWIRQTLRCLTTQHRTRSQQGGGP